MYTAEDYQAFEKYSKPELQRVPLDSSLLQMIAMGLPDPRKFPFIEPPPAESIENSILSLKEHVRKNDIIYFIVIKNPIFFLNCFKYLLDAYMYLGCLDGK